MKIWCKLYGVSNNKSFILDVIKAIIYLSISISLEAVSVDSPPPVISHFRAFFSKFKIWRQNFSRLFSIHCFRNAFDVAEKHLGIPKLLDAEDVDVSR